MFIFLDVNETIAKMGKTIVNEYFPILEQTCRVLGFKGTREEFYQAIKKADAFEHELLFVKKQIVSAGNWFMKFGEILGIPINEEDAIIEEAKFTDFVVKNTPLVKGAKDGIIRLSKKHPLIAMSQSHTKNVVDVLHWNGLLKYFSAIIPMREMNLRKDDTGYEKIVNAFGKNNIIIGDSYKKEGLAEKFGWKFFNVAEKGWSAVVAEILELE